MAQFTLATLARAIRKNGYKQAFGQFVNKDPKTGEVSSACALGQAALNLNVDPNNLHNVLDDTFLDELGSTIIDWNDGNKWSLAQIADRIERDWTAYLDTVIEV